MVAGALRALSDDPLNGFPPPMPVGPPSHLPLSLGDAKMATGGPIEAPSADVVPQRERNQQLQEFDNSGGRHPLSKEHTVPQREQGPAGQILLSHGILVLDFGPLGSVFMSSLQGGHLPSVDRGQLPISSLLNRQRTRCERVNFDLRHRTPRVRGVVFPVVRRAAHVFLAESTLPTGSARKGVGIAVFFTSAVFNLEIELFDFHNPASLFTERRRSQTEPTNSAVIGPQEERATEEDPELPESFHNSQQLLAGGAVIHFSSGMSLAEIRDHPFLSAL